jgi:hypothetical protein
MSFCAAKLDVYVIHGNPFSIRYVNKKSPTRYWFREEVV